MEPSHESLPYSSRLRRLTAPEYLHMVDAGVFGELVQLPLQLGDFSVPEPDRKPDPDSESYTERSTAQASDELISQAVPGLRIPLASVW